MPKVFLNIGRTGGEAFHGAPGEPEVGEVKFDHVAQGGIVSMKLGPVGMISLVLPLGLVVLLPVGTVTLEEADGNEIASGL